MLPILRALVSRPASISTGGRVLVERLPAYAPELNPVEVNPVLQGDSVGKAISGLRGFDAGCIGFRCFR